MPQGLTSFCKLLHTIAVASKGRTRCLALHSVALLLAFHRTFQSLRAFRILAKPNVQTGCIKVFSRGLCSRSCDNHVGPRVCLSSLVAAGFSDNAASIATHMQLAVLQIAILHLRGSAGSAERFQRRQALTCPDA